VVVEMNEVAGMKQSPEPMPSRSLPERRKIGDAANPQDRLEAEHKTVPQVIGSLAPCLSAKIPPGIWSSI
jgi:hypothetical protein